MWLGAADGPQPVAGGHHVAVSVVVEADGHAVGVGQRADEAAVQGDPHLPAVGARQPGGQRAVAFVVEREPSPAVHLVADHPAGLVVLPALLAAARSGAGGAAPVDRELLAPHRAVEAAGLQAAALGVEAAPQLVASRVDQADQPARLVVLEHVDRAVLGVGDDGPVAREVAEHGLAAEGRDLEDHPTVVVVAVPAQPDAVGVPHLDDAAPVVDLVAAGAQDPLAADEVAGVVVVVAGHPAAGRAHGHDAGAVPVELQAPAALMLHGRQQAAGVGERGGAGGGIDHRAHQPAGVEAPHRAGPLGVPVPAQLPAGLDPLQPGLKTGHGLVPAGPVRGESGREHGHLAVGALVADDTAGLGDQRRRGPRGPAPPERSARHEAGRVGAGPAQQRQAVGPGEIVLGLQEVTGGGAHGVVDEPRRSRGARGQRRVDGHDRAGGEDAGGVVARSPGHRVERAREGGVVDHRHAVGAQHPVGVDERLAHQGHEGLVVHVVLDEARQLDVHQVVVADVGRGRVLVFEVALLKVVDAADELAPDGRRGVHEGLHLGRLGGRGPHRRPMKAHASAHSARARGDAMGGRAGLRSPGHGRVWSQRQQRELRLRPGPPGGPRPLRAGRRRPDQAQRPDRRGGPGGGRLGGRAPHHLRRQDRRREHRASLEDFQLPPKTVFERAMPRYPNAWFYVDASVADSRPPPCGS